jgi:hypothetical protein
MVTENELLTNLKHYTGSDQLARLTRNVLLTEGALYLAKTAECFWLLDLYASHLPAIDSNKEGFTCLKLSRNNNTASVAIEDGNGKVLAKQDIEYTDFPLSAITLYGCWAGDFWVVMLTSEY